MDYCTVCGMELDENGVCPRCAALAEQEEKDPRIEKMVKGFQNTRDETDDLDEKDIEENRVFATLGYLGILVLVPIICAPKSSFARFHAGQSINLIIFDVIYTIIASIVTWLCFKVGNALGIIMLGIALLLAVFPLVLWFVGIANAARGQAKELPVIGKFRILK